MAPRSQVPEEGEIGNGEEKRDGDKRGRRSGPGVCLPKALSIPVIQIKSEKVRGNIELWKEKPLIEKFVGCYSSK